MEEASVGGDQTFVADDQAAEGPQPRDGPLYDPPAPIAPQLPAILMGGVRVVPSSRDDRLNPPLSQAGAPRVAGIAPIRD
jgi:hypothetical protein